MFEGGFEVVDNLLGENVGIGEIVGVFEAFVREPEDVEAGFVAVEAFPPLALPVIRVIITYDSKAADRN